MFNWVEDDLPAIRTRTCNHRTDFFVQECFNEEEEVEEEVEEEEDHK